MRLEDQQRMYDTLKEIANYRDPEWLRNNAEKEYGCDGDEAIEMYYENVIWAAKRAIKNKRRPK